MKKGRALLSLLLAAVMAFGLGAAGGTAAFAEGGNPAEAAQGRRGVVGMRQDVSLCLCKDECPVSAVRNRIHR